MANKFETFPQEKFTLVNENRPLKDKELVTKPRGFFADAMYRFTRNKGSIVAAIIIGILFLYAIIAPFCTPYEVSYNDTYFRYTLPKLFNGIDFWDGCSNKTVNENSFLYYYSMGAETGHNAVKRQQYSSYIDGESTMYNIRLDSYQHNGTIFLNGLPRAEYEAIQAYQDKNNVQIIYPITDTALRPTAPQDQNDANYWYKTKFVDGKTSPDEYTIDADGTIHYTNIYSPWTAPALRSSQDYSDSCPVQLLQKDDGFAISFQYSAVNEETGATTIEPEFLFVEAEENENIVTCVSSIDKATVFHFDDAHKTVLAEINDHEDPTLDGSYFFAIPSGTDSKIFIVAESELEGTNYIPFKFYDDNSNLIENPAMETSYRFTAIRSKTTEVKNFIDSSFGIAASASKAGARGFVARDGGYVMQTVTGKKARYAMVTVNGNEHKFTDSLDDTNASIWHYDSTRNAIYTHLTGHADASKDGDYYIAVDISDISKAKFAFARASELSSTVVVANLYVDGTTQADSLAAGNYYLMVPSFQTTSKYYYANGRFDGDNYTSKMRIEGEDEFLYSYARATGDSKFEIRVNYYEYYCYYHRAVLKDRISGPFFLFGTTDSGQDIFTCLASGARFSFILAIVVSVVNMVVGAIYGAIEGYYGGKADLIMERIVEILSAVPFMIVITLLKYHMGGTSQALILFVAFFLTGWIGESGLVRMQFYRFKNQEYVLASRTLGAKDPRIMFRHIFPNALGTIVTSSVLVIPGMIFSETSLSYLGIINLNSGNMTSVGTLLANGQPYLTTYPHIIIFPAIFISLLMLTFNLFGNGLRDAFNPSLRGTED